MPQGLRTSHEPHAGRQRLFQRLDKLSALHIPHQHQLQRLDAAAVDEGLAEVVVAFEKAAPGDRECGHGVVVCHGKAQWHGWRTTQCRAARCRRVAKDAIVEQRVG